MRRALDGNPFVSTGFAEPGYGYFGKHAGYDYGIKEWTVKAPEAGVITNVRIAPNLDGGNIVELRSDKYDHRFLHLKSVDVSKGQTVSEGQTLGISGNTGNVGYHLHHDVRKKGTIWTDSFSNYYDWETLIKQGAGNMPTLPNDSQIIDAKKFITGVPTYQPTGPEFDYYKQVNTNGSPVHGFHQLLYDTIGGGNVRIEALKKQLAEAQNAQYEQVGTLDGKPIYRKKA